jgi:asparagine synthase (glutamine-hydrolysing)
MCGICGVVSLGDTPVDATELQPLNDAMRLRGPDDEGVFTDGRAGLGHRRLSIIDLSGGHQPMANEDGQVVTVLNGEIYNFRSLRSRLEALGHAFRTRSDTEVLVHGYEAWGDALPSELEGMFAFAIWDRARRRLLLARDRFGEKPLAWFERGGRFVFASTLTALLRHPAAPRAIDRDALASYLALELVPAPASIVAGIHKLPPAHLLTVDERGRVETRRYWRLAVRGAPEREPDAEARLRDELRASVAARLVSDVPLGIFLSGGIDSSAVTWAASEAGAGRIKTFSIGFDDPSFDETSYAREVAQRFGTEHIEERLEAAQLLELVPRLGEILDEPMADGSIVPTYFLSRLARRHVTVALGGDGGDELFGGYPTYRAHALAERIEPLLAWPRLTRRMARLADLLPVSHRNLSFDFKVKKFLDGLSAPPSIRNYVWTGAFRGDELPSLLGEAVDPARAYDPVERVYREAAGERHLERVLAEDVELYLPHHVLAKVDRAGMANSLEVRAPMLDTRFAEHAARLPLADKRSANFLTDGKSILKRAFAGYLPDRVLHRPKKGFGMPIGAWLRGPLAPLARDVLTGDGGLCAAGVIERAPVERLLDEHARGRVDHRKRLWTLLVLQLWRSHHRL